MRAVLFAASLGGIVESRHLGSGNCVAPGNIGDRLTIHDDAIELHHDKARRSQSVTSGERIANVNKDSSDHGSTGCQDANLIIGHDATLTGKPGGAIRPLRA